MGNMESLPTAFHLVHFPSKMVQETIGYDNLAEKTIAESDGQPDDLAVEL